MTRIRSLLGWLIVAVLALIGVLSPWMFGAWEVWWFWPFVMLVFIGSGLAALHIGLPAVDGGPANPADAITRHAGATNLRLPLAAIGAYLVFLLYAFVRMRQTAVPADAQRSLLLFLTPLLVAIPAMFCLTRIQGKILYRILMINLMILGLYGILNHLGSMGPIFSKGKNVLWVPGFSQYIMEGRATGPYFCPNHFAGIMEIALALALGVLLAREGRLVWRMVATGLAIVSVAAVILTKSQGGGISLLAILLAATVVGFSQWPPAVRWYLRAAAACTLLLAFLAFLNFAVGYLNRVEANYQLRQLKTKSGSELRTAIRKQIRESSRGRMIAGAYRAWQTAPWLGIGPGMHQDLWDHFAPSPDGNKDLRIWPSLPNNDFHSYEVHSDWMQLLEEYGLVGLVLFLLATGAIASVLVAGFVREVRACREKRWRKIEDNDHAMFLAAVFASTALAVHSLGDFNLQMPATVWVLALVVALPLGVVWRGRKAP